jgi:predicted nucleotidyltransferase
LNSVVFKSIDRIKIQSAVTDYAAWVKGECPEVESVIWFGSWIRGMPTPGSDVDLCLLLSKSNLPVRDRISRYLPLGFPVGIDLFAYTLDEFERLERASLSLFVAISNGKAV